MMKLKIIVREVFHTVGTPFPNGILYSTYHIVHVLEQERVLNLKNGFSDGFL